MLIRLLNPALFENTQDMLQNRYRLNSVIFRRTQADACDAKGEPLFSRRQVHTQGFHLSPPEGRFYEALLDYLRDDVSLLRGRVGAQERVRVDSYLDALRDLESSLGGFTGGVYVAAADVDGDGIDDIVTGAGEGGGPHVKIFSGADGHLIREFMAYDPNFRGGARVAARDVDGDGLADVVTGAGAGGSPLVNVFNGATGAVITAFFAYEPSFRGGVFVAAGDVTGDNHADIVTGAGEGGGAHVRVWDGAIGQPLRSFFPYTLPPEPFLVPPRTWTAGVRVALADVNGDGIDELVVAPGRGQTNPVRVLNFQTLAGEATIDVFFGGAYVG
jgi:hypothetical protein